MKIVCNPLARMLRHSSLCLAALGLLASAFGFTHPGVLAPIGQLYAKTLSTLRPRVLVQGNPHYLGQPAVVAEVRAALLAAVRSAVLWRQRGGSLWDLALQRRRMLAAVEAHLG